MRSHTRRPHHRTDQRTPPSRVSFVLPGLRCIEPAVVTLVLVAVCASFSSCGGNEPTTSSSAVDVGDGVTTTSAVGTSSAVDVGDGVTTTSAVGTSIAVPPVGPAGFERVAATVTAADGNVCEVCLWLAETGDQRSRGLMGVTDVGNGNDAADGMAFVYPNPHTGTFWMKNTLLSLSIVFYAESGEFLASFDMEPCAADPCPTYPTAENFRVAIEVPQGDLESLLLTDGSTLTMTNLLCPEL